MNGKLFWCEMPISEEELLNIQESHRIRPYLLFCKKNDDEYYAFAATSQMPSDYSFENDYIILGKSQVKLDKCYTININDLYNYNYVDDDGKLIEIDSLSKRMYSELIKKLRLNIKFDTQLYPSKVISKINKEYDTLNYNNKDILFDGSKYIVCTEKTDKGYKVYDISFNAIKGYVEFIVNGNLCYINPNYYYLNDVHEKYDLSFVSSKLPNVLNSNMNNVCNYNDSIDTIDNLPIGSLIGIFIEDDEYIFIKIESDDEYNNFLVGRKGSYKRDYVPFSIRKGEIFPFQFYNILTLEKLDFSLKKVNNI